MGIGNCGRSNQSYGLNGLKTKSLLQATDAKIRWWGLCVNPE